MRQASANAARLTASGPSTAAGSGIDQCAVTGRFGQAGHDLPGGDVANGEDESSGGAPDRPNSSQLLDRSAVGRQPRLHDEVAKPSDAGRPEAGCPHL